MSEILFWTGLGVMLVSALSASKWSDQSYGVGLALVGTSVILGDRPHPLWGRILIACLFLVLALVVTARAFTDQLAEHTKKCPICQQALARREEKADAQQGAAEGQVDGGVPQEAQDREELG